MADDRTDAASATHPVVLTCGLATLDVMQTVDRVPSADEKVVAQDLLVQSGGPAANAAVTGVGLGVRSRLLTRIGSRSTVGTIVTADLRAWGVEVVDVAAEEDSPAVSTVLVTRSTGERAVVSVNASASTASEPGGSVPTGAAAEVKRAAEKALTGTAVVLVDGHHLDLAVTVARAARSRGVPVVLDGGSWKPGLEALLAEVDVAVLSADFTTSQPDTLAAVAAWGPRVVAQSHGQDAIEVLADGVHHSVAVPTVAVVDSLGAGDVLHGALAAWVAVGHGQVDDVVEGLRFAAQVASASCTRTGARGWQSDDELVRRLRADLAAQA